jgi:hypothetical protein
MMHETGVMKKACFLMLVCILALAVASFPDALCYPPAGSDYMERTTATIELQIYGPSGFYETIVAKGPTNVSRSDPYDPGDGRIKIDTEIVSMNLVGASSYIGPITVVESPSKASTGKIRQQTAGMDFPADSFFDVYVEIKTSLPSPLGTLHNDDPKNMTAVITSIPPFGSLYESPITIYLKDELDNIVGAMLATRHKVESSVHEAIHDVGIISVTTSKNVVGQGYTASVNVMLFNYGNDTETFNVTAYYGNGTLTSEQWDIFWSMGDCNRDGYIDQTDADIVTANFGWTGSPGQNPADVNSDGVVNIHDATIVEGNVGYEPWWYFLAGDTIGTQTVANLPSGNSTLLTFAWNTTGLVKGNYTINAYSCPVQDETDTTDNSMTDGWILVTIPGDVDGDLENGHYDVDLFDAVKLLACYGAKEGDSNFDPNCDIDDSGQVFLFDAVILLARYGQKYP